MKKIFTLAFACTVALASPTASMAQEITPEHLVVAQKYVEMTDTGKVYETSLLNSVRRVAIAITQQNPELQEQIVQAAREVAQEFIDKENPLYAQFARIYAIRFSPEELEEIVAFYESEVGQKLLKNNVGINQDLRASVDVWEKNFLIEFETGVKEKLNEQGLTIK